MLFSGKFSPSPVRITMSLSDKQCLSMALVACPSHYPGWKTEFTLELCRQICPLIAKKSHLSKGLLFADDCSLHFWVCSLLYFCYCFHFPKCTANKGKGGWATHFNCKENVLFLAWTAIGPVTCHNPVLYAGHREASLSNQASRRLPTCTRNQGLTGALIIKKLFPWRFWAGRDGYAFASILRLSGHRVRINNAQNSPSLGRSHVAYFPGCKLLILLFCVQRPLEILRISVYTWAWARKWGITTHWKMSSDCLNKILSGFFHADWALVFPF